VPHDTAMEESDLAPDPSKAARSAGLRYVSDQMPGFRRRRAGRGFRYLDQDGHPLRDKRQLTRIKALAIPPAWTDVWICSSPRGHLQATGRDDRGRKQYRYHDRWREVRDETKYERLLEFAAALPRIRERIDEDLAKPGLPREKVLATVVRLLESTLIRVGSEEYVRSNRSYGLTTLRNRHVDVDGSTVSFQFRGKSGRRHAIGVRDRRVARVVQRCQDLPGQELFQYVDEEGETRSVDSADVNDYLREISGSDFTAKDFRTWAGTVLAAQALEELSGVDPALPDKQNVVRAIERVAERLGNTPAVCRKCYVHPAVLDAYLDGSLALVAQRRAEIELSESLGQLRAEEAAVIALLQQRLSRDGDVSSAKR
jgi:DNA topoisomerase I